VRRLAELILLSAAFAGNAALAATDVSPGEPGLFLKLIITRPIVAGTVLGVLTFGAIYLWAGDRVLKIADRLGQGLVLFGVVFVVVAYFVLVKVVDKVGSGPAFLGAFGSAVLVMFIIGFAIGIALPPFISKLLRDLRFWQ
jgi:hypothetical protein